MIFDCRGIITTYLVLRLLVRSALFSTVIREAWIVQKEVCLFPTRTVLSAGSFKAQA